MTKPRLENLEFLRAGCALMVMFNHLYCESAGLAQNRLVVALSSFSVEAVIGFFVLSGCVISLQNYDNVLKYLRARLVRLFPIYYVVLAFSAIAMLACGASFKPPELIANGFFLQTLHWDFLNPIRFFVQSWSLSYELYYYISFAAIMVFPRLLLPLFFASAAVGVGLYFVERPTGVAILLLHPFSFFCLWLLGVLVVKFHRHGHSVSPATAAHMFIVGVCMTRAPWAAPVKFDFEKLFAFGLGFAFVVWALLSASRPTSTDGPAPTPTPPPLSFGLPLRSVISTVALGLLWFHSDSEKAVDIIFTGVVLFSTLQPAGMVRIASVLARPISRPMIYIGGLSYALYLIHYPVLQIFNALQPFTPIVNALATAGLSFGLAYLLDYRFQPWIRSHLTKRA